jgi:hypothetical protein
MRSRLHTALAAVMLLFFLASITPMGIRGVSAAGDTPPGPDRFALITENYSLYHWWLTKWDTNTVACSIDVDHEGLPQGGEIFDSCGNTIYDNWINTTSCEDATDCRGYYLQLINSEPATRKVSVKLSPPVVWVSLQGCVPYNSTFRCDQLPTLVLSAEEPIDGQHILNIAGMLNGKPFTCDPVCQVDLIPTGDQGLGLTFWAYSSYGDSSESFQARVRVIPQDDSNGHFWYTDVLSTQWRGVPLAAGSMTWDSFPPVGGTPLWLSTPLRPTDLATNIPYEYLTAHLIKSGVANASNCADGGLLEDGSASPCGLDVARPWVNDWQNRFDALIFSTAQSTGIPAELLKNIFARESQFWPGVSKTHPEAGLGQMTQGGADTTLLWNRPFFEQFCPSVLDDAICQKGYAHIQEKQQQTLDDALVGSVNAFCPDCPLGIDLDRAENSVYVFAQTLLANTEQVGMLIYNSYNVSPGSAASYEDLWRFTLVNYNAGSGCLTLAIRATQSAGETLEWVNLSDHFTEVCQPTANYVNGMSSESP